MKQPAVYIMASRRNGTLYTGVTSNLPQRAWQHREGTADGFTRRYGCKLLVWFEAHATMESAILREKQIKAGSRAKKAALINALNPDWRDLHADLT
jgi:putative endonuclease